MEACTTTKNENSSVLPWELPRTTIHVIEPLPLLFHGNFHYVHEGKFNSIEDSTNLHGSKVTSVEASMECSTTSMEMNLVPWKSSEVRGISLK